MYIMIMQYMLFDYASLSPKNYYEIIIDRWSLFIVLLLKDIMLIFQA